MYKGEEHLSPAKNKHVTLIAFHIPGSLEKTLLPQKAPEEKEEGRGEAK